MKITTQVLSKGQRVESMCETPGQFEIKTEIEWEEGWDSA